MPKDLDAHLFMGPVEGEVEGAKIEGTETGTVIENVRGHRLGEVLDRAVCPSTVQEHRLLVTMLLGLVVVGTPQSASNINKPEVASMAKLASLTIQQVLVAAMVRKD